MASLAPSRRFSGTKNTAIALGLLSDYEAMSKLPRHIAKIMSLCIIYCMDVRDVMDAAGVGIDDSAKLPLPMPDRHAQIRPDLPHHVAEHAADRVADNFGRRAPHGGSSRYAQSAGGRS